MLVAQIQMAESSVHLLNTLLLWHAVPIFSELQSFLLSSNALMQSVETSSEQL